MFTDLVGYTALGQRDESLSLALLDEQRKLVRPILARHNGREVKTVGDAFLVEFLNAVDAVRCGYDIQRAVREFNFSLEPEKRIHLRVGVHVGEVVESQGDISGDAVNVASRIEPLAEDGGVCVTHRVYDLVHSKVDLQLSSIGTRSLKNVSEPMEVYKVVMPWEHQPGKGTDPPRDRIAILPFSNMSPDPSDAFFADGITEEIISTTSGISGLSVISRTSVMSYKATTKRIKEIGRELEVGSILEGSIRKAGNRIRVTTQLIDVASDRHIWSQSYDRSLEDVFEVQSDVAKQVADSLRVRILSSEKERIERRPTENKAAYTFYLKGRSLWNKRGLEDVKRATECFEQAISEDPKLALGYAGLADCYSILRVNEGVDPGANLARAKEMVGKALELDQDLAEAHAGKGSLLCQEFNFREGEEEFKKAVELKPGYATAHQWYSLWVLDSEQRWDEALQHIEKAVELDPLSPIINLNHGDYHYFKRDYPRALESYLRGEALDPNLNASHWRLARTYGMLKMYEDMAREHTLVVESSPEKQSIKDRQSAAEAALYRGDEQAVRRLLPGLEADTEYTLHSGRYGIACMRLYLGDLDEGFLWLERAYSGREISLVWIRSDPLLDRIRTDLRYLDLLKRLGLG